ncbi:MAG TPA: tail fiber domain-containing protein [Chloroflexota bacterium]
MSRRLAVLPSIVLAVMLLAVPAARGSTVENAPLAAPPTTMTYQGLLRANGAPATGPFSLQFKLYSVPSGGSPLYTETDNVTATNGLFTVVLGQNTPLPPSLFQPGGPLFLGITVGADPELTPRTPITTEPFAFLAGAADSATSFSGSLAGDVTGAQSSTSVTALRGTALAATAPTSGQVLRYNGTQWAPESPTSADTPSTLALRDASGNLSLNTLTLDANLALPSTTSSAAGVLTLGGSRFLHSFGTSNTFLGGSAGNFTLTGDHNTAVGANALPSNTTGSNNTATGASALLSNTTGGNNTATGGNALATNTTGSNNTATGASALLGNTTGGNNTATGGNALQNNTTGDNNAATGVSALQNNTTGSNNTATGASALLSNTTGGSNTATGGNALQSNTTGTQNTATGTSALQLNTTGGNNTAVGFQALQDNTTGPNNAALGYQALQDNTTGGSHAALGAQALQDNTTGLNNAALGFRALQSNTTGFNNTAVGANSNVASGALTNATALGANAIVDASNKVRIGNTNVTVIEGQVAFTFPSDRNKKEHLLSLDGERVLATLPQVPVYSWNYIGQDPAEFRHYGPTAQDLFAAFGHDDLGAIGTPTTINSGDLDGLLLAAVQALAERTAALQDRDDQLAAAQAALADRDAQLTSQQEQIAALDARLAAIERLVTPANASPATAAPEQPAS